MLWKGLEAGAKFGFSVGGSVKRAMRELNEGIGKLVKTFYDVELKEVSITPKPANFDAWLVNHYFAKSYEDAKNYYDNFTFYNKFLSENPQLDYLAVFEKSIGDKWIKVDSNNSNNKQMKIVKDSSNSGTATVPVKDLTATVDSEHEKTETSTAEEEHKGLPEKPEVHVTEPAHSTETAATKSYVDAKFNEMVGLLKEIRKALTYGPEEGHALDSESPDTKKTDDDDEDNGKKKDREGQEGTYADGDNTATREHGTETVAEETPAVDQQNPSSAKNRAKAVERPQTGAERQRGEVKDSEKVEAVDSEMPTEHKRREKGTDLSAEDELDQAGTHQDTKYSDTGHADSLDQAGREKDETSDSKHEGEDFNIKATDDSEDDSETNKYGQDYMMPEIKRAMQKARAATKPFEAFVYYINKTVQDYKDRLEEKHMRIPGLESSFADAVRESPEIQKAFKEWLSQPGFKKSISLIGSPYFQNGTPMIISREGGRAYRLVAEEVEADLKKSIGDKKDFRLMYKTELSSTANGERVQ
jgi:hypothetical protein